MSHLLFSSFSPAAVSASLTGPARPVSSAQLRSHERRRSFWKLAAVAMGALACFTPVSASVVLIGGGLLALRRVSTQTQRLEELRLQAAYAAMRALEQQGRHL